MKNEELIEERIALLEQLKECIHHITYDMKCKEETIQTIKEEQETSEYSNEEWFKIARKQELNQNQNAIKAQEKILAYLMKMV